VGIRDWYCWHNGGNFRHLPNADFFLPWHRAYIKTLEDNLRDQDPNVAQPWWDWSSPLSHREGIPQSYKSEPLNKFHIDVAKMNIPDAPENAPINKDTTRHPMDLSRLPTPEDINNLYDLEDFVDFSRSLEQIHNGIHMWVSGTFSDIGTSAFDPLFFAHHANIDRIWYIWQLKQGNSTIPSEWLDKSLAPFPYTFREVLNINTLGYDYATMSAELII